MYKLILVIFIIWQIRDYWNTFFPFVWLWQCATKQKESLVICSLIAWGEGYFGYLLNIKICRFSPSHIILSTSSFMKARFS